jgi:leucyl-tRNA synthetase
VTEGIEGFAFNRAIAKLYEFANALGRATGSDPAMLAARRFGLRTLAQLMQPMTPHLAEEIWAALGGAGLVSEAAWPEADPAFLVADQVVLPVQVNGKRRAEITAPAGLAAAEIEALVLADPGGAAGARRRDPAPADRRARPDRECGALSAEAYLRRSPP